MLKTMGLVALAALYAGASWAGHANPWATEDDVIYNQEHEDNLVQSIDTPGEDEMLGVMVRSAHGKLDGLAGGSGDGSGDGSDHEHDSGEHD
ncbi:hypothetical protein BMI86_11895 [Thioclava sp. DLFJ5-1]|uniref:hypothetical protein n=1 Tax=Thioclava sp. DLFJ5-1 TaxID=1915314 RepID=UPI0009963965|nr:hypothetical protein [Thioclava sp. DLFJ5-1]OOY20150.1 hypothetical protein BMI86_11895 [Thioclava sp. DLFJ5-1]